MKLVYFIPLILLAGCESMKPHDPHWDKNCERNYSENKYELEACKKRVEENASFVKESGGVSIDPDNTDLPATDEIRKDRNT